MLGHQSQIMSSYWPKSVEKLVVTTALILTFSAGEKGQRLQASLYAVVRRANPVACALGFMASMRELFREILSPEAREIRSPPIRKNLLPGRWNGLRGSKNVQDVNPLLKGEWARAVDVRRSAAIFPKTKHSVINNYIYQKIPQRRRNVAFGRDHILKVGATAMATSSRMAK